MRISSPPGVLLQCSNSVHRNPDMVHVESWWVWLRIADILSASVRTTLTY